MTLKFIALFSASIVIAVVAAILLCSGYVPQGILAVVGFVVCVYGCLQICSKFLSSLDSFATATSGGISSSRLVVERGPRSLKRAQENLNRIAVDLHDLRHDLTTSKLYYDKILKVMTHEMRNSITPIIAVSNSLKTSSEDLKKENLADAVEIISDQANGIKRFLDAYQTLTHLPQPEIKEVYAEGFVKKLMVAVNEETGLRGLPLTTVELLAPKNTVIKIDESLMRQAIVNLIRNALDSVGEKHKESAEGWEPSVKVQISHPGESVCITVIDNGGGVGELNFERLFEPFFTTKQEGSGIGLFLTRQIVGLHGGDIKALTLRPSGLQFSIEIPG